VESSVIVGMKSDKTRIVDRAAKNGNGMVVDSQSLSRKIIGVQNASVQAAYAKAFLGDVDTKSYTAADNAVGFIAD
jgi:hypothetical protein